MKRLLSWWWIVLIVSFLVSFAISFELPDLDSRGFEITRSFLDVQSFDYALGLYHQRHNSYPSEPDGLQALVTDDLIDRLTNDPWGFAYRYRLDSNGKYKVYSVGINGIDENGVGDDVTNREKKTYRCEDYGVNCPLTIDEWVMYFSLATFLLSLITGLARGVMFIGRRIQRH